MIERPVVMVMVVMVTVVLTRAGGRVLRSGLLVNQVWRPRVVRETINTGFCCLGSVLIYTAFLRYIISPSHQRIFR